jgi:CRISPR-associated protein Csb2
VHCVPLDSAVPPPPGFDPNRSYREWISLTPYVPPRHVFNRQGKQKEGEAPAEQLAQELKRHGFSTAEIQPLDAPNTSRWVKVHRGGGSAGGPSNLAKRGFRFSLIFREPVAGPIAIGGSSHFGLGLFVPANE